MTARTRSTGANARARLWSALLLVAAAAACAPGSSPADTPPNLIVLSIDTLRADHLGLAGYPRPTSPTLDELAGRSVVFDQAVTVQVSTAPAHATVLTGRYPAGHGIVRNGMRLRDGVATLAEILGGHGWATGAFVSGWTLQRHTGLDRGFSVYDDDLGPPRAGARRDGNATTDAALQWMRGRAETGQRFFLFLHLFEPHWPYDPPPSEALRFLPGQRRLTTLSKPVHLDRRITVNRLTPSEQEEYVARYDGEIVIADRIVKRVLYQLEVLGIADTTAVVVLSDHGETLFERSWTMDHGARPYDEQARVPLLVRLPHGRLGGRRVPDQVSLLDVAPTVLEVVGLEVPDDLPGRSLLPLARGDAAVGGPRPAFVTARCEPERVPHIAAALESGALVRSIRLPTVELVEYPLAGGGWHRELFNLVDDPGETVDLSGSRADLAVALHGELDRWQAATGTEIGPPAPELDPEVAAALRELGYLDD